MGGLRLGVGAFPRRSVKTWRGKVLAYDIGKRMQHLPQASGRGILTQHLDTDTLPALGIELPGHHAAAVDSLAD